MSLPTPHLVADLNDAFRKTGPLFGSKNRWIMTGGVSAEGVAFTFAAIAAVEAFDSFTPDNDPYGERDFGSIEVNGHKLFWKIDYYDSDLTFGAENPADPSVTRRVMTIMLASEY